MDGLEVDSFYFDYLDPRKIVYSPQEIKWILYHSRDLREGHWPMPDPCESTGGVPSGHANFETACLVIAEVDDRLADCDDDGLIVKAYYSDHDHDDGISKNRYVCQYYHIDSRRLNQVIGRCLYYVSGQRKPFWFDEYVSLVESGIRYRDAANILTGVISLHRGLA
jgi:hypothetical protein